MPHFEGMKCAQPIQVVLNIGLHGQPGFRSWQTVWARKPWLELRIHETTAGESCVQAAVSVQVRGLSSVLASAGQDLSWRRPSSSDLRLDGTVGAQLDGRLGCGAP
jgi:hypothetical protein